MFLISVLYHELQPRVAAKQGHFLRRLESVGGALALTCDPAKLFIVGTVS